MWKDTIAGSEKWKRAVELWILKVFDSLSSFTELLLVFVLVF